MRCVLPATNLAVNLVPLLLLLTADCFTVSLVCW